MKKLIIALFLLPMFASAQTYQAMPQAGYGPVKRMLFDSVLTLPLNILKLQNATGGRDIGQIRYNVSDSSIYIYSGSRWIKSGIDTSTIYYNLGLKLNISDTAQMMTAAPRVNRFLDSIASLKNSLALKLNISDTASMLTPYTRATQTALKLNISDTAGMLSAYTRLAANSLKLNISDTAAMMAAAPRVQRFLDSVTNLKTSISTKQNTLTLTTTGTSGAATLTGATLNIPQYSGTNIYNGDGSLTGNRTLTLNSQPLTFLGTTRTRFFANGRMAIGDTVDAGYRLDVIGEDARFYGVRVGRGLAGIATNTGVGNGILGAITTGAGNTAIGNGAGAVITTGANNTIVGYTAGTALVDGSENVLIGSGGKALISSSSNVMVGFAAGGAASTGTKNTYVGWTSGKLGSQNTAIGAQSLPSVTGSGNTAIGQFAGFGNTSGAGNIYLGFNAGTYATTQSNQIIITSLDCTNYAGEQTKAILYGQQTLTTASQILTVNGNLGINNISPAATAVVDITSTTKGFLPPRMTTTQRTAITSPAEGLTVYDLTLHKLYVYDGTIWQAAW